MNHKHNASNLKLTAFNHGEKMAATGTGYYSPYENAENTAEFKRGWNAYKARTHGSTKVQPVP